MLSVNKKMRPSLIAYIQKTIKENQETFRKEIEMATKTIFEKKSLKSRMNWENYLKERSQRGLDQGWRIK